MDQDWENRVLCSDGNCIGVIGADNRCKECGKLYEGRLPDSFGRQKSAATTDRPLQTESESGDDHRPAASESEKAQQPAGDDEWENRVLCSDGNCIGVIGADGRCKECGKPYTPEAAG